MPRNYKVTKLESEQALLDALGIKDLAGNDVPDCSHGALLIRFNSKSKVSESEVQEAINQEWKGDLPVILVSDSGFTSGALESSSEFEDAHLFAPSA